MRHSKWIVTVTLAFAAAAASQAADVYRYVDAKGETHYTDRPVPGAELVRTTNPRPPGVMQAEQAAQNRANAQNLGASNQRIAANQSDNAAAAQVQKDLAASRAARCKQAREAYQQSINAQRVFEEKDGQRSFLNDQQLAQYRVEKQRAVDAICGPQG
jgi:Spy/CpxP family protein refolding chaperone